MFRISDDTQRLIAKYIVQYEKILDAYIYDVEEKVVFLKQEFYEINNIEPFILDLLDGCARQQILFYTKLVEVHAREGREEFSSLLIDFHESNNMKPLETNQFMHLVERATA